MSIAARAGSSVGGGGSGGGDGGRSAAGGAVGGAVRGEDGYSPWCRQGLGCSGGLVSRFFI